MTHMHTHQTASHFWSIRQAGFPRWTLSQVPEGFRRQSSRTAPGRVSGMGPWGLPSTFPGTAKIDRGGEERGGIQIRREVRDLLNGISLSLCLSLSLSVARWLCSLFVPGRLLIAPPTPLSTCSLSLSLSQPPPPPPPLAPRTIFEEGHSPYLENLSLGFARNSEKLF